MRAGGEECFHAVSAGVGRALGFVGRKAEGITVLERFRVVLKSPEQGHNVCLLVLPPTSQGLSLRTAGAETQTWMFLFTRTASFAFLRAPLC